MSVSRGPKEPAEPKHSEVREALALRLDAAGGRGAAEADVFLGAGRVCRSRCASARGEGEAAVFRGMGTPVVRRGVSHLREASVRSAWSAGRACEATSASAEVASLLAALATPPLAVSLRLTGACASDYSAQAALTPRLSLWRFPRRSQSRISFSAIPESGCPEDILPVAPVAPTPPR